MKRHSKRTLSLILTVVMGIMFLLPGLAPEMASEAVPGLGVYAAAKVEIKNLSAPASITEGVGTNLLGTVSSSETINSIEVGVVAKDTGKWTDVKYENSKVNAKTFDLKTADAELKFRTLPQGTYYYRVIVHTGSGDVTALNQEFKVVAQTKPQAKITLKDVNYPVENVEGWNFYVRGTITSDQTIKRVEIGVVDNKTSDWAFVYDNSKVNAKSFDVAKADSSLRFSSLTPGTYFYRIYIHTDLGTQVAVNEKFTVVKETASNTDGKTNPNKQKVLNTETGQNAQNEQKPAEEKPAEQNDQNGQNEQSAKQAKVEALRMYYPAELNQGENYEIRGRINTDIKIDTIEVGIVDKATGKWTEYRFEKAVNDKTFALSEAQSKVSFNKLAAGTYYYRIVIHTEYGEQKAFEKEFKVFGKKAKVETLRMYYPTTLIRGEDYYLRGRINTDVNINSIEIGIAEKSSGNWVGSRFEKKINAKTFAISEANAKVDFSKLAVGSYYYRIVIHTDGGEQKAFEKEFKVTDQKAKVETLRMYYPKTLEQGEGYNIRGRVNTDVTIKKIEVGIAEKATGNWTEYKYSKNINAKTFACSQADSKLQFSKLAPGNYYYKIVIHTQYGQQTAFQKEFEVKKKQAKVEILRMYYPKQLTVGENYNIRGRINANVKMKNIQVGVVDKATGKWTEYVYTSNIDSSTFACSAARSKVNFSKLPAGTYYYRIVITTKFGDQQVYQKEFSVLPKLKVTLSGENSPTIVKVGTAWDAQGRIESTRKITKVEIGVVGKKDGKWTKVKYTNDKVNATSFDIGSIADKLNFASLPAGGYYYRILVYTEGNESATKALDHEFTVDNQAANIKLTAANYPTSYTEGTSFYVQGTISSDLPITKVQIGMVEKNSGNWTAYKYENAKVNSKSFNIKNADSSLMFSKLAPGAYYYRINVFTAEGSQTVMNKEFTVNSKTILTTSTSYINGIDVSTFQGNIDWTKVKNSGVQFAIIRCGFRGYTSGSMTVDNKFHKNITGAKGVGLKVGVYFFSQAVNYKEGVEEANYVCDLLEKNGYKVDYPIAIDTEYINSSKPGRADKISKAARTQAILGFCDQVKKRGYEPMIYASTSWYSSQLDMSKIGNVKLWAAQWSSTQPTGRNYVCWQYTSSGSVSGISGRVDMNRWFK